MNLIPRLFPGGTVVCIGSGPSLTVEDVNYVEGKAYVVAVNDAYRLAPWADVLYAADHGWWQQHMAAIQASFKGQCWTQSRTAAEQYHLNHVMLTSEPGMSNDPATLHSGSHSGYQALNLAYLMGAKQIILLGYDCQRTGGKDHWFGQHTGQLHRGMDVKDWADAYDAASNDLWQAGTVVINASRATAIEAFLRLPIDQALSR